jgi:hypothetical protein
MGVDDGDARTESGAEEGLRWWQTGEVDAWAMGEVCAVLSHGQTRRTACGGENDRSVVGGCVLRGAAGRGELRAMGAAWRRSGRERGRGGGTGVAWSSTAARRRRGSGLAAARAGEALPHDSGERRGRRDAGPRG